MFRWLIILVLCTAPVLAQQSGLDDLTEQVMRLVDLQRYDQARPLAEKLVARARGEHGVSTYTAGALDLLARILDGQGHYLESENYHREALQMASSVCGPQDLELSLARANLAAFYHQMGEYGRAAELYQAVLKTMVEWSPGPDDPETASVHDALALAYHNLGDYAKAEEHFLEAVRIREDNYDPDIEDLDPLPLATGLSNLGNHYLDLGDAQQAQEPLDRALGLFMLPLTRAEPSPGLPVALGNLSALYLAQGDFEKAQQLGQQALDAALQFLGADHPTTATLMHNMGHLLLEQQKFDAAEKLWQSVLQKRRQSLGAEHPQVAESLYQLARLSLLQGAPDAARDSLEAALSIQRKALGSEHLQTSNTLELLARVALEQQQPQTALQLARQVTQAREKVLANILSFTSEGERLAYWQTNHWPYRLLATLSSSDQAEDIALAVLRNKGVILDSLLEDRAAARASSDPDLQERVRQLKRAKRRLLELVLEEPESLGESLLRERIELAGRVEAWEKELARKAGLGKARRALNVTLEQVQEALPADSVLVEFIRYQHYLGSGLSELRYGAVVIYPGRAPSWVGLGEAKALEQRIRGLRRAVLSGGDARLSTQMDALYQSLWAPVQKLLPEGVASVIVSPDSELSFVPFAALTTPEGHFLGERLRVMYVASGRDLLWRQQAAEGNSLTMFANPAFSIEQAAEGQGPASGLASRELTRLGFEPLPGTETETTAIANAAKKASWEVAVYRGPSATEERLSSLVSPAILHLATHGFFLSSIRINSSSRLAPKGLTLQNPMLRSGLAMAGAATTVEAWRKGHTPPADQDGILSAQEVGSLDLSGTSLVVLSACDTALGEAAAGEGVMGLRRGFGWAGARYLLMTLWPVSDEHTAQIMTDFYGRLLQQQPPHQALAEVQREWLVRLKQEQGLARAVSLAGPFMMTFRGAP